MTMENTPVSQNSELVKPYNKCRAKPTGKIYETDFVHLITIQNGKVIRFREFFDTYAAAEAFRPDAQS